MPKYTFFVWRGIEDGGEGSSAKVLSFTKLFLDTLTRFDRLSDKFLSC